MGLTTRRCLRIFANARIGAGLGKRCGMLTLPCGTAPSGRLLGADPAVMKSNVTRERAHWLWSPLSVMREIRSEFAIVVGMEGSHRPVPPGEMCRIVATEELMVLIVMRHAHEW